MPDRFNNKFLRLAEELYPLAEQTARILDHFGRHPDSISRQDYVLAAQIQEVSAQHVAMVKHALIGAGLADERDFSIKLVDAASLSRLAANFEGIAHYLRVHQDHDVVRLVLTEPGENSSLRREIDRRGLPPRLFQTRDAFMNLAHSAQHSVIVLVPFIDDEGARFLIELFSACRNNVSLTLICRPLSEAHCGPAFRKQKDHFRRLKVSVYEYALPSLLPSRRETFHAKIVLADDAAYYVGSSNFMGSSLERSLEAGAIVHGQSAKDLHSVMLALKSVATLTDESVW
jgi:hypothetical protein